MHVKCIENQSPPIGMVWKFGEEDAVLGVVKRHGASRRRAVRNPSLEESILNVVADTPKSSTRAVAEVLVSDLSCCSSLMWNNPICQNLLALTTILPLDALNDICSTVVGIIM
ncbi:hypothetical protein TNCV_1036511 [Trichonephila clavipes]|nr:hypothetical protein TNCV_1036511 [Trichonephila clavipes]